MASRDTWMAILAVLVYSGPILPLIATLFAPKTPRARLIQNIKRLLLLSGIQALAFVPYIYGLATDERDAEHALSLPFFTGIAMFLGALLYAASEFSRARQTPSVPNDA
jgi:hypothetical protein